MTSPGMWNYRRPTKSHCIDAQTLAQVNSLLRLPSPSDCPNSPRGHIFSPCECYYHMDLEFLRNNHVLWVFNLWENDSTHQHYVDHMVLLPLLVFHYMVLWSMKVVYSKSTFIDIYDQLDSSERQPMVRLCNSCSVTRPNLYWGRYLTIRYVRLN